MMSAYCKVLPKILRNQHLHFDIILTEAAFDFNNVLVQF